MDRFRYYYYHFIITLNNRVSIYLHTLLLAKCKDVFKSLSFTVRSAWALFTKISAEKAKRWLLRPHANHMHFEEITTKTAMLLNLYTHITITNIFKEKRNNLFHMKVKVKVD